MAGLPVDPVNFHDSTAWTLLVENAYDKAVEFKRRAQPLFKQFFNKKVVSPTNDSDTYIFTLHNDFPVTKTPLVETTTPSALAATTPERVSVTVREYGAYAVETIFLDRVAFTQPNSELVALLARQQGDTVDSLALDVINTTTNIQRAANRASDVTVAAGDVLNAAEARRARTKMDRSLNMPLGGGNEYIVVAHPDQLFDLKAEAGANTWSGVHTYGGDTSAIYSGEVGSYMGLRFVQSTRSTIQTGAGAAGINVYSAYIFADQAVAEVELQSPTVVIGPDVDALKRFRTLGWKMTWGANLYRPEALLRIKTASSFV